MEEAKDTSALAFKHSDMAFQLIETRKNRGKYGYDLLINGHAFSELHKARLAQKLLPKVGPLPSSPTNKDPPQTSKNIIHIRVEGDGPGSGSLLGSSLPFPSSSAQSSTPSSAPSPAVSTKMGKVKT